MDLLLGEPIRHSRTFREKAKKQPVIHPGRKIIRILARLAGWSAAWLGVVACDPFKGPVAAYGCPCADYKVSGVVRSSASGAPVPGVSLAILGGDSVPRTGFDSTVTSAEGSFSLMFSECGGVGGELTLRVRARDTVQPTRFKTRDTACVIPRSALHGGDGKWDEGTADTRLDIALDSNDAGVDGK